ncbi:MAG: hypothetical protein HY751_08560 [Nitrospinae bacterium]|nr:hypothetical protein [Nitrospinota bacterium]
MNLILLTVIIAAWLALAAFFVWLLLKWGGSLFYEGKEPVPAKKPVSKEATLGLIREKRKSAGAQAVPYARIFGTLFEEVDKKKLLAHVKKWLADKEEKDKLG